MGDALRDALARIGERSVQVEEDGKGIGSIFRDGSEDGPNGSDPVQAGLDQRGHVEKRGRFAASTCGRCGMRPMSGAARRSARAATFSSAAAIAGSTALAIQPARRRPARAHRVGREQRVVEAAQAKADHEDHGQAQRAREVPRVERGAERHEESAHALDDREVRLRGDAAVRLDQRLAARSRAPRGQRRCAAPSAREAGRG